MNPSAQTSAQSQTQMQTQTPKRAVLLLAHGTPETVEEIPEYLKNVVSGRSLPQHVIEEIQRRYAQIGKSPLTEWTLRQAALLQQALGVPVYVGMRNWKPYIADTVRTMRADGVTDAVAICLAPQNSRTSVGLYRRAAFAEAGDALRMEFIEAWADHPRLIDAFAERLRAIWTSACKELGSKVPVLFTAHSVPCRTIQMPSQPTSAAQPAGDARAEQVAGAGPVRPTLPERSYALPSNAAQGPDPYPVETKRTAALVAKQLAANGLTDRDWVFAFQSQGASGGPWIGPTVEETLQTLKEEGHTGVVLQPIGFLCDHVEILYDIDIAFQELAQKIGLKLWRPESLNASPLLIEALADLAQKGFRAAPAHVTAASAVSATA
ncbi:MAG TPA: ferrochelatase [Acidobacteriaceae bacterium]|jgi:ferrochelatase|nr:ferrochelatase [Acidobacteriaceae bacterium]